jgi:TonB family protein
MVYTSSTQGNLIHLKVADACFQTISSTEFGQLNRKLLVEQQKVIKEYRDANQILQLVEHAGSEVTNPEILIFNEALRSQVKVLGQSDPWTSPKVGTSNPNSSGKAGKGEVYDVVETLPIPSGGMAGWSAYLSANLGYPTTARRKDIEGTVIVAFVVNTDGTVSDFEVLKGIGGGCDEEALRIVRSSPKWTPGMQDGKVVRTRMRLPLTFQLEDDLMEDSTKVALDAGPNPATTDGQEAGHQEPAYGSDEVDTPPNPIGETAAWNLHLSGNLTYPTSA